MPNSRSGSAESSDSKKKERMILEIIRQKEREKTIERTRNFRRQIEVSSKRKRSKSRSKPRRSRSRDRNRNKRHKSRSRSRNKSRDRSKSRKKSKSKSRHSHSRSKSRSRSGSSSSSRKKINSKLIFLGGITREVKRSDIEATLGKFAVVKRIFMNGRCAFIEVKSYDDAEFLLDRFHDASDFKGTRIEVEGEEGLKLAHNPDILRRMHERGAQTRVKRRMDDDGSSSSCSSRSS